WVVASTIVATVLFGFMLGKAHRAGLSVRSLRFEGILLLAWWVTILAACAFAFMIGMGGYACPVCLTQKLKYRLFAHDRVLSEIACLRQLGGPESPFTLPTLCCAYRSA